MKQFNAGFLAVTSYPQWAENVVPVPKKDGKVRMCVPFCFFTFFFFQILCKQAMRAYHALHTNTFRSLCQQVQHIRCIFPLWTLIDQPHEITNNAGLPKIWAYFCFCFYFFSPPLYLCTGPYTSFLFLFSDLNKKTFGPGASFSLLNLHFTFQTPRPNYFYLFHIYLFIYLFISSKPKIPKKYIFLIKLNYVLV